MLAAPAERNEGVCRRIAKEVAASIEKYRLPDCKEPREVPPHHLLVSKNNRNGQPLTLLVVHEVVIKSLLDDGADPTRPSVGVATWFKRTEAKMLSIQSNTEMFSGSPLYPPIYQDSVKGETLSSSHFNCALRCFHARMCCIDGRLCEVNTDADLASFVERGHKWWLLDDACPVAEQMVISEWKNQDQNANQVRHEIQLIRSIQTVCHREASVASVASVASIAGAVNLSSTVKVSSGALCSMVKFVMALGADNPSVDRVCTYHANRVNPNERIIPHTLFDQVGTDLCKEYKHLAAAVIIAGYSPECVIQNVRPRPDHCRLFVASEVKSAANAAVSKLFAPFEERLAEAVAAYEHKVAAFSSKGYASLLMDELFIQAVRMLFGKKYQAGDFMVMDLGVGKPTEDKLGALIEQWVLWVDSKYPSSEFAASVGVHKKISDDTPAEGGDKFALPAPAAGPWHVGDQTEFTTRVTVNCPLKTDAAFRVDLQVGQEGFITSVSRLSEGFVMIKLGKTVKGVMKTMDVEMSVDHLKRPTSSVFGTADPASSATHPTKAAKGSAVTVKGGAPAWTKVADFPDATVVTCWEDAMDLDATLVSAMHKQWALAATSLVHDCVPDYTADDLLIVMRESVLEVWTQRSFKAYEICFAPVSPQVKDCYWTLGRSVLFSQTATPHPSRKHLVLDGRTMARTLDDPKRTFSPFWCIQRVTDKNEANLTLHFPTVRLKASVTLPGATTKCSVDTSDVESVVPPVLTNVAAVKARTRLVALDDMSLHKLTEKLHKKRLAQKAAESEKEPKKAKTCPT